jgi:predicted DNA-binding protein YlxM (UPF0122 family)
MTTEPDRTEASLRQRVQRAILSNALFDWRGGIVVALSILLSFFGPELFPITQGWMWLLGGAIAWGLLVISIIKDPETGAQVAANLLRQKYEPTTLRSPESRERLIKAFEYRSRIAATIAKTQAGVLREHLEQTAAEIDDWISNLFSVAQRIDVYESDRTIQQDLKSVPASIQNYEMRLKGTSDPALKKQIEDTLESRRSQQQSLQNLQSTIERGKLQMDQTLSSMGTVYSQLLLMDAKDIDSGRYQRLRDDIAEEVKGLHEVVQAMDEVYQYKQ